MSDETMDVLHGVLFSFVLINGINREVIRNGKEKQSFIYPWRNRRTHRLLCRISSFPAMRKGEKDHGPDKD